MNKLKLSILGIVAIVTLFSNANTGLAAPEPVVSCNSATVYGDVWPSGHTTITAWFEWGTSQSTVMNGGGQRTPTQSVPNNPHVVVSANLFPLNEKTTYYYRFAMTSNGTYVPATTETFSTPPCQGSAGPEILYLRANPNQTNYGGASTITWDTEGATYCMGYGGSSGWSGNKNLSGSFYAQSLTSNTTFTLTCHNSNNQSVTKSVTVTVASNPTPNGNITASNCTIPAGQSKCNSFLNWSVTNLIPGLQTTITREGPYAVVTSGHSGTNFSNTYTSIGSGTTMFSLRHGTQVLDTANATATCDSQSTWNGSVCAPSNSPINLTLTANPNSVPSGGTSIIAWNATNATTCVANGGVSGWSGTRNKQGDFTAVINQTTTFHISCSNQYGQSATRSVVVSVQTPTSVSGNLSISPTFCTIPLGASTCTSRATWSTHNASSPRLVDRNTAATLYSTQNGTNQLVWVSYPQTVFDLKDGNQILDTKTATASCASGTWDGTKCASTVNPIVTVNISANPLSVQSGGSSTISWTSSQNATYCIANGGVAGWNGTLPTSGSFPANNLTRTTTFTIQCMNATGQQASASVMVTVGNATNLPTASISAYPTTVNYNGTSIISWSSQHATYCVGTGGTSGWASGNKAPSGTFPTGPITSNTTFTIVCYNSTGQSATQSVTVYVTQIVHTDPSVETKPATNIKNNSARLNGFVDSNNGNDTQAWFEWGRNTSMTNTTPTVSYGNTSGTDYNYTISGLSSNTTYYFRAVARNAYGDAVYGARRTFTTNSGGECENYYCEDLSVSTYPATTSEGSATLRGYVDIETSSNATVWFEWGPSGNYLTNTTNSRYRSSSGNFQETISNLSPNTIYYFRAAARASGQGTVYGNTLSFTASGFHGGGGCGSYGTCAPTAITTLATNISQNSARLNGLAFSGGNSNTTGYFEYGRNLSLGSITPMKNLGMPQSTPFFESVFGLSPNTLYYYRAVVTNQYGTSQGEIATFRTGGTIVVGGGSSSGSINYVYNNTSVVSSTTEIGGTARPSLVLLSVSRNGESVGMGSIVEFIVHYKNVSSKPLRDVLIRTSIPKEFQFMETSWGFFSEENSLVITPVGDLYPGQEGSVRILVRVKEDAVMGKMVVVTANLAYTIVESGIQEETFAYSRNTIAGGMIGLGAASIFGMGFLPNSLLGWLLLILIILLLVAAIRWLFTRPAGTTVVHHTTPPPPGSTTY
ncbi:MAG TPA: hypothetical protein VFQ59_03585 [Candidatus Paceibacterota bacterium]|nr:hypothetical protein [Candidatus Paceibacterota bacterium]